MISNIKLKKLKVKGKFMSKKIDYKRRRRILIYSIIFVILIVIFIVNCMSLVESKKLAKNTFKEKDISNIYEEYENEIDNDKNNMDNILEKNNDTETIVLNTEDENHEWNLILVNQENKLSKEYLPDLVEIEEGFKIDIRILDDLKEMLADARKLGFEPWICSAYRSYEAQEKLFNNQVDEYLDKGYTLEDAKEETVSWILEPGSSEHATGLSLDIVDKEYQLLDEKQADRDVQKWLMENSYKYGFILRYPENKKDITKVDYEPWHYRYVGREHAEIIYNKKYVLEEYIDYLDYYER